MGIPITSSEFDTSNNTGGTEEIQMIQLEKMHEVKKETVSIPSPLASSSVTVPSQDAAGKPSRRSMLAAMGLSGSVGLLAVLSPIELLAVGTHKASDKETKVTPLTTKPLPDFPGKEVLIITVDYPPGGSDPIHRHDAHSFIYVLEGSIVMGVKGGEPVTLHPGETFYEGPMDIHTIGRNASDTKPARFVVFLIKNQNVPAVIPVN